MDNLVYTAMNGASHILAAQTLQMNNLANVKTVGFREDLQVFVSEQVNGGKFPTRVYLEAKDNAANLSPGAMVNTGNALDVAIQGNGWFAVQGPDGGKEALTRAGNFMLNQNGQLVTPQGYPVIGEGGPIAIPQAESITIGSDGTISIRPVGQETGLAVVGKLKLSNPSADQITKGKDGFFYRKDGAAVSPVDTNVRVAQGMLEHSNVNPINALIDIISLQRQFELEVKMMKNASEAAAATSNAISSSS